MDYRREIDGLRALAVVPVILFHAGFSSFSGGFVGVDVFFVISGYLITSIIASEINNNTFTIAGFYERRARRILPALFVVMLACLPFAWMGLIPQDMKNFAISLIAVPAFVSNILFFRTSGYFEAAAELQPLLHTWSLAVEEQYYLFFPLLLMVTWRLGKSRVLAIIVALAIASLAYAQWSAATKPTFAFYMLPTRIWELLIGALVALAPFALPRNKLLGQVAGAMGLGLIVISIFLYDKTTPFPGLYALAPTLGTALVIAFATPQTAIGRLLGSPVMVTFGLLSYSAYLWHQPLFAFAKHMSVGEPDRTLILALAVAAFGFAYLSWRFVEAPFRGKARISRKRVIIYAVSASVFFITLGLVGVITKGFESRFNDSQKQLLAFNSYPFRDIYRYRTCFLAENQSAKDFSKVCDPQDQNDVVVLWGDSHAAALSYGVRNSFANVAQYTTSGCPPMLGAALAWRPMCKNINDHIAEKISKIKPSHVILHANWDLYKDKAPAKGILATIDYIKSTSPNSRITLVGGVPHFKPSLPTLLLKTRISIDDKDALVKSHAHDALVTWDGIFAAISRQKGIAFVSALSAFCTDGLCRVMASHNGNRMPITWDYGHLTAAGSQILAEKIKETQ